MSSFFTSSANTLTAYSNHLIDWSRVGELLSSGTHRYTLKELAIRGVILGTTAVGGYQGYQWTDEGFGLNSCLYSMAGCFIGFVVSHTAIIAPLILKRYQMSQACQSHEVEALNALTLIKHLHPQHEVVNKMMSNVSEKIKMTKELTFSDDKHARASQTLGTRKTLMAKIACQINDDLNTLLKADEQTIKKIAAFWSQPADAFFKALKTLKYDKTTQDSHSTDFMQRQML